MIVMKGGYMIRMMLKGLADDDDEWMEVAKK